ncbi:hypothetical protein ABZU45_12080 [Streptomyces avermitilis]|uniref:hypothetical protein n=1 Tax=Streptomyces avermitilis TaxID=33903 RepID=UPI0033A64DFD
MRALWWAGDAQRARKRWWAAALVATGLAQVAVTVLADGKNVIERWTPALGLVVSVLGLLSTLTQSESGAGEVRGTDWLKGRADALAEVVQDMWAAEARLRRLQDPEPLPGGLLLLTTPDRYGMHGMSLQMALVMGPLALSLSAYGRLTVARIWLGAAGQLPWRLMAFLHEAHLRGVLRQSGARYEFRHLRLQECLAARAERGESEATAAGDTRWIQ